MGALAAFHPRVPSTWLVYRGSRLVLVARRNGREIECRETPDGKDLALFHSFLHRAVRPLPRVVVEMIDGEQAASCAHTSTFREVGFQRDMGTLMLERIYA